jgi:ligand-binding sensor domain-containing protein
VVAAALAVAAPRSLDALDTERAITQFVHESWIAKDGAPAGTITGITQTPEGYLWLGTEGEGLVRFDGVRFERETRLDVLFGRRVDRVTSVLRGRDGTLWVGTTFGLARRRAGLWAVFDRGEAKDVLCLHEAADGTVWYARHWEGLFRVSGESLTPLALAGGPRFVTSDTGGAVWAGGYEGLWRLDGGDRRRYSSRDGISNPNVTQIYGDRAGNVWVGFQIGLTLLRNRKVAARFTTRDGLSSDDITALFEDRQGTLWVGTGRGGLNRRRGGRFESLTRALGLTSNRVTAIYEDREGSLWVGTSNGLNRLRDASLLPIGEPEGLSRQDALSIVEGRDGIYVASGFGGVNRIEGGRVHVSPPESVPGSDFDGPLYADPDGGIWSGHRDGLSLRRGNRGTLFPVPGVVSCLSGDARGIVFASDHGEVFRLVGGKPERYRLADGTLLGPETLGSDYVWMIHVSREGTLWLATSRGVFAVQDGVLRSVWRKGVLSARSISEDEQGTIWLGTMAGLMRVAGGVATIYTTTDGLPHDDVYHALSDRQGGIWVSGARGIFRLERKELEAIAAGRRRAGPLSVEVLGAADGMRTSEATSIYQPAGCLASDGRVWFTTADGVVVADPPKRRKNPLPPPVVVEKIVADGWSMDPHLPLLLPPGTVQLAIHYNGLSLLVPSRVRFKYRLEGYDRDWVDAEGRRQAYYTKLPPGNYRFHVVAANNDGVWNDVGASADIRQLPRFHQTTWFLVLATLAVAGGLWGAFWLRVKHHRRREAELQERIREALANIKTLSGLLPICAWCKKVRDDSGYWSQIETYVKEHTEAEFSHGICPDCGEKLRAPGSGSGLEPQ